MKGLPRSATFRNKRWVVKWRRPQVGIAGMTEHVDFKQKVIQIDPALVGQDRLETLIHEALHAADWSKDEDYVETDAKDLTRWLWRCGVRITECPAGRAEVEREEE